MYRNPKFGGHYYYKAHRFVYYVKGKPKYYFSDMPFTVEDARKRRKWRLAVCGILSIIGLDLLIGGRNNPMVKSFRCISDFERPRENICVYCGGRFSRGAHTTCPHCGVLIRDGDSDTSEPYSNTRRNWDGDEVIVAEYADSEFEARKGLFGEDGDMFYINELSESEIIEAIIKEVEG